MSTWLGWLIDWGTPVTLLAETPEQVADAQRELVRIGIDRPAAQATGTPRQWSTSPPTCGNCSSRISRRWPPRRPGIHRPGCPPRRSSSTCGWATSGGTATSRMPCTCRCRAARRLADIPAGTVWVHCGSGYRAALAASLLANAGRDVVLINDLFDHAEAAGVRLDCSA